MARDYHPKAGGNPNWEKGKSANKIGRPKGTRNPQTLKRQQLAELVIKHGDKVIKKVIHLALHEDDRMMLKLLVERILPLKSLEINTTINIDKVAIDKRLLMIANGIYNELD